MEEKIEWFCGIKRNEVDEEYKKYLKVSNKWYLKNTREAYDKFCEKKNELCKKEKIKYEELRRIFEEYLDEIIEINCKYIVYEGRNYCKCFMRKREVIFE